LLTIEKLISIIQSNQRVRTPPAPDLTVTSFEKGLNIWDLEIVKRFFFEKSMKWIPKSDTAVFIPCSAWKPYPYSQSHKHGYLRALRPAIEMIDLFVVSEPMGIVPYCYSDEYPVDSYDYDPYKFFIGKLRNKLAKESIQIFIERVATWVREYHDKYRRRILILPKSWHFKVYAKALSRLDIPLDQYKVVTMKGRASNSLRTMREQLQSIGLF